ncbi:MAG: hypothetical protein ACRD1B_10085 [Thermoanaerobaculia bacterium]
MIETYMEQANPVHPLRLLRAGGERRGEKQKNNGGGAPGNC